MDEKDEVQKYQYKYTGGQFRLSPKVKLLWMAPYIGGILLLWILLSGVYLLLSNSYDLPLLDESAPYWVNVLIILIILLIVIGIPAYLWVDLYYRSYTFTLTNTEIQIRKGIFKVDKITIPYDSIENTSVEKNVVAQLLGIGTIVIDTAGGDQEEGIIPGVVDPEGLVQEIVQHIKEVRGSGEREQRETMNELLAQIRDELREIHKLIKEIRKDEKRLSLDPEVELKRKLSRRRKKE